MKEKTIILSILFGVFLIGYSHFAYANLQTSLTDSDGDGVLNPVDNCPLLANSDQVDTDHDGRGDACDPFPLDPRNDADGDGISGHIDNCPSISNRYQVDTDHDGRGDACDPFPLDPRNDADGDGISGHIDNCTNISNPSQLDTDNDGKGDACDTTPNGDIDNEKVIICHNGKDTISVSKNAVPAHLAHGDILGTCSDGQNNTIKSNKNK